MAPRRRRRKPIRPNLPNEIQDALNKGLARFLVTTQSKLSAANPIDTGRMASSWWINEGVPDRQTRPEDWAEPGAGRVENPVYDGPITFKGRWFLSNSVPYAYRVAFDPMWSKNGRRGGPDWFTRIENGLPKDAEREFNFFLRKLK